MVPVSGALRKPQVGDSWTFRLSYPRIRGQWGQKARPSVIYDATIASASGESISDAVRLDGGELGVL